MHTSGRYRPIVREATGFEEVQCFAAAGARERVAITDTPNTLWFVVGTDGSRSIDGCAGLLMLRGRVPAARVKGVFIAPEMRGLELGTVLTEYVLRHAVERCGVRRLEAFALNPAWYIARGFTQNGCNAFGVARMVRAEEHQP